MKKMKNVWAILVACFLVSLVFGVQGTYAEEAEAKPQVIQLLASGINPATATIKPGTTVIWVNESPGEVEVRFTNTENMMMACGSPLRFIQDLEGQFISDMIPFAGVASICFIKKGEFSYVVARGPRGVGEGEDETKEYTGKLIIK